MMISSTLGLMVIDVLILVILLIMGVPLPYCFVGAFSFIAIVRDLNVLSLLVWGVSQMANLTLVAGPVFILCGTLLTTSEVADKILDTMDIIFGKVRAGLGFVVILTCGFIGAISGSSFTGISAVGPSLQPRMVAEGYPKGYSAALIASSTILGIFIPPSVSMIIFGWVTGVSVLACFLSTVLPAVILMILMGIIQLLDFEKFRRKSQQNKLLIVEKKENYKNQKYKFLYSAPALFLPILILGGIYGGVFTATEAACVATGYTLLVGLFFYKSLNSKNILSTMRVSGSSIGAIMTMIFFCLLLSQAYVMLDIPRELVRLFTSFTQNKILILLFVNLFLGFIGMIVNDTTAIVLCAPILLPLCQAYGISGVNLAAIMVVSLGFGSLTPPYASVLYLAMRVCNVKFQEIVPPAMRFVFLAYIPTVILTTYIPFLSNWLPQLLGFS